MSEWSRNPSVADLLAFEQWPREQQEVARAALFNEIEATRDDIWLEAREEYDSERDSLRELVEQVRALVKGINEHLAEARDVTKEREYRQHRYASVQEGLVRLDHLVGNLERVLG